MTQPMRLVLLRHAQREWNAAGIFTGMGERPPGRVIRSPIRDRASHGPPGEPPETSARCER